MLNLLGQVLPAAAALVTIPFLVRGLGTERFGILSIAWVVLGSSGIFDLGLGRATTKFVAGSLGRGEHGSRQIGNGRTGAERIEITAQGC